MNAALDLSCRQNRLRKSVPVSLKDGDPGQGSLSPVLLAKLSQGRSRGLQIAQRRQPDDARKNGLLFPHLRLPTLTAKKEVEEPLGMQGLKRLAGAGEVSRD